MHRTSARLLRPFACQVLVHRKNFGRLIGGIVLKAVFTTRTACGDNSLDSDAWGGGPKRQSRGEGGGEPGQMKAIVPHNYSPVTDLLP